MSCLKDMLVSRLSLNRCIEILSDSAPVQVLQALMNKYADFTGKSLNTFLLRDCFAGEEATDDTYCLKEADVARFRALEFLKLSQKWDYDSFIDTWKASLPEEFSANPEYLDVERFPCVLLYSLV